MKTTGPLLFPFAVLVATLALAQTASPTKTQNPSTGSRASNSRLTAQSSSPDFQDEAWRVLWLGLHSSSAAKRVEAVKALSLIKGNQRATAFALRALNDKDSKVRTAAASTLGQLHAIKAIPHLREALSDKEISVVLAAAYALYLLKDRAAYEIYYSILMGDKKSSEGIVQAQLDRLKDPKQVAEMAVQEGLGFVPFGGMGYEAYRTITNHDNSPVRAAAARFLAHDPDSITEDALIQTAVADNDLMVREAALDALAERGDRKCIERLAKNLEDNKYPVRYRTAATIILLRRVNSGRK
ncbi:MAG TPA: HEAT repeat domain-containing protein [Terriglobales bacterium]|nr:HEAT repeat domain-containing protein [Terriglobales bacterium]